MVPGTIVHIYGDTSRAVGPAFRVPWTSLSHRWPRLVCASSQRVATLLTFALAATALPRPLARVQQGARMVTAKTVAYPALTAFLSHETADYHLDGLPGAEARRALLLWYDANRRRLPWRGDAPPYNGSTAGINAARSNSAPATTPIPSAQMAVDAYGVWVSEIMCQQTRVEAVIPYWLAWMEAFPNVEALAAASEEEVNARWAGLGFYRRARMLHEGAKQVVGEMGGVLPDSVDGLMRLKGIGRYTAGAIASICYGVPAPIVDGNVLRVVSRLCAVAASPKEASFCADGKLAWQLAERLVAADGGDRPGDLNQAIMELGATLCAPGGTGVDARDPLAPLYASTAVGREAYAAHCSGDLDALLAKYPPAAHSCPVCRHGAEEWLHGLATTLAEGAAPDATAAAAAAHGGLPLAPAKKARREERLALAALFVRGPAPSERQWLLVRRPDSGLLAGQWEFPHVVVASDQAELPDAPVDAAISAAVDGVLERADLAISAPRTPLAATIEHIFSHVRHTMHVEFAEVGQEGEAQLPASARSEAAGGAGPPAREWRAAGRVYSWMGDAQMKQVGVTTGVRKVIAAVSAAGSGAKATGPKGKRKAAAGGEDRQQAKMSQFFKRKDA